MVLAIWDSHALNSHDRFGKPLTVLLSVIMSLLFICSLITSDVVAQVALIVSNTVMSNFYVWNIITGSLLETNFFKICIGISGLLYFGSRTEGKLGLLGFAQYVAVVMLASGIVASTVAFLSYVVSFDEQLFTPIYGPGGLLAGLTVAFAHQSPNSSPFEAFPAVTSQAFPLALGTVWTGIGIIYSPFNRDVIFLWSGAYFGWAYLRFVCHHDDGSIGNTTPEFEIVNFFPKMTRKYIKPFCNFCYGVMLLLGFFKNRKVPIPPAFSNGQVSSEIEAPSAPFPIIKQDAASERRRAKAMKLLDEKFAQIAQQEVQWQDDDESGEKSEKESSLTPAEIEVLKSKLTGKSPKAMGVSAEDDESWGLEEGAAKGQDKDK